MKPPREIWAIIERDREGLGIWYVRREDASHKEQFLKGLPGGGDSMAVRYVLAPPKRKKVRRDKK